MDVHGSSALVTGGASGLGRAVAEALVAAGALVTIADLAEHGPAVAAELGGGTQFAHADVADAEQLGAAVDAAAAQGQLRVLVHCAGRGGPQRVLDRQGQPTSLEAFEAVVRTNLVGSFNALRLAASAMSELDPVGEERGVCVLTASVAAFEGQIGQMPYAASKAGVVGMTITAARDLAARQIRVCTIAPGLFDTPILARLSAEVRASLASSIPHPPRLGRSDEFARLTMAIIDNPMLNGETIRLDGAIRMAPR
jgi:NAD(P)-dependent dehydrogenase (short-subunit alcohol dehydrogenase family)